MTDRKRNDMDRSIINRLKKWIYFGISYVICFRMIEKRTTDFHVIHTRLDDMIPFCEYFVIPYLLWFAFVGITILYFCVGNCSQKENDDFFFSFFIGSALFLMISVVYPNIQNLRPTSMGEGIWSGLVNLIYRMDTPTNILPSLHVYNSVVCLIALMKNEKFRRHKGLLVGTNLLTILIILSTMLLKQHSVVDVIMALLFNSICYYMIYRMPESEFYLMWKNHRKKPQEI